jgi:hypothetical protein
MRNFIWLLLLIPVDVFAKAPECPLYANKHECLSSVEKNYREFLDFIDAENGSYDEEDEKERNKLLMAAADIKHFESLACQKTCLN